MGTYGYASPDGLGCTNLTAQLDTKVVIPPGITIARTRLTRPIFASEKQLCVLTHWLHGVLEDNPAVPIVQVRRHTNDVDDVIQDCTGWANPDVIKTQRRHLGMEGTMLLFAAHKPTTKKAGKDKYPLKHPHLDTLRNVVHSKPAMSLANYSLTNHSPYRWKPELVGLTAPVLMESEDLVLPIPMCHALPLIATSKPVKQVDVFREVNEELSDLGYTGHVFKEEFVAKDGEMLAKMKMEADNVGQRWGGIFRVAWPNPDRPPNQADMAAVYAVSPTGSGGQDKGLQLPHGVLWVQRVVQRLSTKYAGLFLVKVGYVWATSDQPQLWHRDLLLELQNVGVEHAFSCFMPVNLDCPMDSREKTFVYGFGSDVPYPWREASMSMLAGEMWIMSSYIIHRGGAVPRDAPAQSTRIIAFATIATRRVHYQTTVPIIPPPWAKTLAQQPSPPFPMAVHCIAARCNRVVKADPLPKCFACDYRPLCAVHVGPLCVDCQRDSSGMCLLWRTRLQRWQQREQRKSMRGRTRLRRSICAGLRLW